MSDKFTDGVLWAVSLPLAADPGRFLAHWHQDAMAVFPSAAKAREAAADLGTALDGAKVHRITIREVKPKKRKTNAATR